MNTVKQPQIHLVYNRRKTASPTRKASVELRITYNYKQKYISTGVMLYPNQWKNGHITNCENLFEISNTLTKIVTEVRQVIIDMMNEGWLDIMKIQERLTQRHLPEISFIDFCRQRARIRKYGKSKDTQERYDRFIRLFCGWGVIRLFKDINEANIILYDKYLTSHRMKPYSKWNNYHRFLNSFIADAIDEGYITKNPYKWVHIHKNKSTTGIGKYLTPYEFRKLRHTPMPTYSLEKIRDMFVFQTYTCLSFADLKSFNPSKIQEIRGMKVYKGKRHKTGKDFTIPILSPAWDVLMKYGGQLPVISNVKYNEYLKAVAQSAGIDKPVSSHWARHTGATLLLNEGVAMGIVSKVCGHSSTKITEQVYAKLLDETVVNALSNVII